jgi:predicted SAM-dependent methyltransferase
MPHDTGVRALLMKQFLARTAERLLNSRPGAAALDAMKAVTQYRVYSYRTANMMAFDILRLRARIEHPPGRRSRASQDRLHFGCGRRRVAGWLNVDVAGSEFDIDLACGALPWIDAQFRAIVSQHTIEHLELESELLPLLVELRRVAAPNCEIWLTCPDMERVCAEYGSSRGKALIDDRLSRPHADLGMADVPSQHMINAAFQQSGEHRNLLDFELLAWALGRAGFADCVRMDEARFLARFPEFPVRGDDPFTLYVQAVAR